MEKIDLFIGHFSEGGTTDLPAGVSFAGNYYQNKIRSILKINHSVSVFYGGKNKKYESNDGFENVVLKQGSNISNILHIVRHLLTISSKVKVHSTILFYNLNIYTLFYFAYFKFIKKAKVVVLLADAGFLLEHGRISQLVSKALSFSHGILTLREIPELRKFKSKIEVMPGIISKDRYFIETEKTPNTVLLSGSLGITTGLVLALEYFSNQSQLKLIITGVPYLMSNAEFESLLSRYKNRNIEYLGILDYKEYIKVSTSCEFGLSLRNPNDIEHHYNFP